MKLAIVAQKGGLLQLKALVADLWAAKTMALIFHSDSPRFTVWVVRIIGSPDSGSIGKKVGMARLSEDGTQPEWIDYKQHGSYFDDCLGIEEMQRLLNEPYQLTTF